MKTKDKIRYCAYSIREGLVLQLKALGSNKKIDRQIYALGQFQMKKKI